MNRKILLLMMVVCTGSAVLVGCSHAKAPASNTGAAATAPPSSTAAPAGTSAAVAPAASGSAAGAIGAAPAAAGGAPVQPDLVLLAGSAFDGCKAPVAPPDPPDGHVATEAQMLSSHQRTSDFNSATNAYLACLDLAAKNFNGQYGRVMAVSNLRDVVAIHDRIHNKAVDADHAVADKFNRQLGIYKARRGAT